MDRNQKGFTLIEILVVVTIIGVLAGLVVVLIPKGKFEAKKTECRQNVKNIISMLIIEENFPTKYGGVNLILQLIKRGKFPSDEDTLKSLFCPGDLQEKWDDAGGLKAYGDGLDITKKGQYDHLSSYAGRDQPNKNCRASSTGKQVVLICDDSEDHHDGKGFVVGLTGGAVKWRHKFDDWDLSMETSVEIGEGSAVKELECLRAD